MGALSDLDVWKRQWEALMSAPYIIVPLLVLMFAFAWWLRGHTKKDEIAGLRERMTVFEDRLKLAAEKAGSANEAKNEVEKQFQALKTEVAKADTATLALIAKVDAALTRLSSAN